MTLARFGLEVLAGSVDDVAQRASEIVAEGVGADVVGVLELVGDQLVLRAGVGWSDGAYGRTMPTSPGTQSGATLRSDEPIVMADSRTERRFRVPRLLLDEGIRSDVSVVIGATERPLGMLAAHHRSPRAFADGDVDFVQSVANLLAVTLERDRSERALRHSELMRRRILEGMVRAQEQERANIATELHDDAVQVITATLLSLDRLQRALADGDAERAGKAAGAARRTLSSVLDRTRRLMFELRPPVLEAQGLGPAVSELAAQTGEELGIEVSVDADVGRVALYLEELVYRAVQEAIANVRKHSHARHVAITLRRGEAELVGGVVDDGVGFDVARALDRSRMRLHLGLDALEERIRMAGGETRIESRVGEGTRLSFSVPIRDDEAPRTGDEGRARRHAANELRVRALNEEAASAEVAGTRSAVAIDFSCECFRGGCTEPLRMTATEWREAHRDSLTFAIAPDHEDTPDLEVVTGRTARYWTVTKIGDGARESRRLAASADGSQPG
jgi:signal transduction histidine kinase